MSNTKEKPSAFDPMGRTAPDEPFFPLVARDPLAAPLVERWADEARKNARQIEDEAERKAALIKCNEAEEIAWEMRAYRKGEKAVTAKRASMSEAAVSSETPADKLAMIEGCQAFREAAYHLKMAEEKLASIDAIDNVTRTEIELHLEGINDLATEFEAKRDAS